MNTQKNSKCLICNTEMLPIFDLPNLPLTETFCDLSEKKSYKTYNQKLLLCKKCNHGQLENFLDPAMLYGNHYQFKTSKSNTARNGTMFFYNFFKKHINKKMNCVVDIGCNDTYLLSQSVNNFETLIGIDPSANPNDFAGDGKINLINKKFEDVDIQRYKPDVIFCRHTIEHIKDPLELFSKISSSISANTSIFFEMPIFDNLIKRARYDQVFHQHYHYFSYESFKFLLDFFGLEILDFKNNYHDWGAAVFYIKMKKYNNHSIQFEKDITIKNINFSKSLFTKNFNLVSEVIYENRKNIFGYGAAQMLPVIFYHLGDAANFIKTVIDDDVNKNQKTYKNLDLLIRNLKKDESLADVNILLTAIDNFSPIMEKLLNLRPKSILLPLLIN